MSDHEQCPSTKGAVAVPELAPEPGRLADAGGGTPYWRSMEEFSRSGEFKPFLEREFPAGASELAGDAGETRRTFLKLMGAGLALAGAATIPGCRRPERKIMPYSAEVPEEIIPGKPLYYATAIALPGGGAEGLLVETHEGRPTHVEGNPLHPNNRGKTSVFAKASVLSLYDPDRLKGPTLRANGGEAAASWDDFLLRDETGLKALRRRHASDGGRGLAFVVDKKTSPTLERVKRAVMERYPQAAWVDWNAAETPGALGGAKLAFGGARTRSYDLAKAKVVLSLDSDFMCEGPRSLTDARAFASTRVVRNRGDEMSRLYACESAPTGTGASADHRLPMSPSRIAQFAVRVAQALASETGDAGLGSLVTGVQDLPLDDPQLKLAELVAEDLIAHRGSCWVFAGPSQPAEIHALAHAINEWLGGEVGVGYSAMPDVLAGDSAEQMGELTRRMESGSVSTLVCVNANPLFDAPASFGLAWGKVAHTITLSVGSTETAEASEWSLNGAHDLESWSDVESWDGTVSVVQPMIAPLYDPAKSDIELLALIAGLEFGDGYDLVTDTWSARAGQAADSAAFEKTWRRALHDGFLAGSAGSRSMGGQGGRGLRPAVDRGAVARALQNMTFGLAPAPERLEVVFTTGRIGDGRGANNAWLQELPDLGSSVVWDNPACVSPQTAEALGLMPVGADEGNGYNPYTAGQMPRARRARLTVGGVSQTVSVWVLPGMPDNVVSIKVGYGRTVCGRVGDGVGDNVYPLLHAGGLAAAGAVLADDGGTAVVASTQNHWSMESRTSIVRAIDKRWFDEHAGSPIRPQDVIYGTPRSDELNLAEQLGELSHTPDNMSSYVNPQNRSRGDVDRDAKVYRDALRRETPPDFARGPQWGMTIDLNACTGCGVCTVACQSENNIPVVGKAEVAKGREMAWIRVDRYFTGHDMANPDGMLVQPMACVHCENAPCEVVCPVNATVHGPEGTNNMAYNRCIGTRYCANNCPYKVRRFNFFDWGQTKFRGGLDPTYVSKGVAEEFDEELGDNRGFNQNFIPPRLRAKVDEISKMQMNPDVTVRSRGVMEKCSYCVQRVNAARHEVKVRDIWADGQNTTIGEGYEAPIPDGFFQAACQQACPTGAIAFGDILDPTSRVSAERASPRSYMLLGYLDTRPRTLHLMRVRNPNEAVLREHMTLMGRSAEEIEHRFADPLAHHGGGHGGEHGDDHHGGGHGGDDHDGHLHDHGESEHHGAREHGTGFIDRFKRDSDRGYAMSLRILGGAQA